MYTVKQTATLTEGYAAGETISALASILGKTEKSVIGKLVNLEIYKPKAKASKVTGEAIKTKASYVTDIEKILEVSELIGLEKAPKNTLVLLKNTLEDFLGKADEES